MPIRTPLLLLAACLAGVSLHAADNPFVGQWKINFKKSKVLGFRETIEDVGNHQLKITFGDDSEDYYLDGQAHPTRYGSQRTVTSVGPDKWMAVTERDGKVTSTDLWTIQDGSKSMLIHSTGVHADGTSYKNDFVFKRVKGKTGLAGVWESSKVDPDAYPEMSLAVYEGDGLAVGVPSFKEVHNVKFDGQDYPNEGPRVAPGATTSGKRVDEHTVELTDKLKDKVMDTVHLAVSADGKTMTATITYPGVEQKEVDVYERP